MQSLTQRFPLTFLTLNLTFFAFSLMIWGCGGGDDQQATSTTEKSAPPAQKTPTATAPQSGTPAQASATPEVDPDRKETKWIGKIPYDVFYDQPLTIAADSTVIGGTQPTSTGSGGTATPTKEMTPDKGTPPESGTASAGEVDWAKVLPMPILLEELKSTRTSLTGKLQTLATYNKSEDTIGLDGAMIAALGAIITVHPDADTWKDRGKFIRDLGYEIYSNAGGSGRAAYKSTEEPFLKLQTAMDGGTVDGLDSEDVVPFSDVIYVADMMQRIELIMSNLKANINTAARMKEDPESVERELRLLFTFGTLMGTDSYDNTDAKQYQGFVASFVNGSKSSLDAVQSANYEGFRMGLDQIQVTCAECHDQYRGKDGGF